MSDLQFQFADLEITFHTEELRDLCVDESIADQRMGEAVGAALRNRLGDIRAADSIDELVAGRPRTEQLNGTDVYRVDLVAGASIVFAPNHVKPRLLDDGTPDWGRVRRVRITHVGN